MNNPRQSIEESTYAASTALSKDGLSGLLNKGLVREFIRSAVGENLRSLSEDFLSANLMSDIRQQSSQSNQWNVLRVYIQMANAVNKEEHAFTSLRREISEHLMVAAQRVKPSEDPALDLKTATSIYDKHAKCDASKKAAVTALQIVAQPIIDNPSSDKNLVEAARAVLEATRHVLEPKTGKNGRLVLGVKKAFLLEPNVE